MYTEHAYTSSTYWISMLAHNALRHAGAEARKGNNSIRPQVRDIGSKFVKVEISTQEAVYIILQLPMRKASQQVVVINTSTPGERVKLLKPLNEIEDMEDECEEIYTSGLLKWDCKCPTKLEDLTTAAWVAWYDCNKNICETN